MQTELFERFDNDQKQRAEEQLKKKQKDSDFDIREFPVELIFDKYTKKVFELGKTELFLPDYQRDFTWNQKQKSLFIESVLLDLPIPYIYVADVRSGEDEGRIEIVDGSQRTRTLVKFLNNEFELSDLELLNELNGFRFCDFPISRQLRFKRKTIRFIELLEVDEEARRQIFYRLNSGGTPLRDMEKRFGTESGPFFDLVKKLSASEQFRRLCPVSDSRKNHREYEELVLRFFAYRFDLESYKKGVAPFLDNFMKKMNGDLKVHKGGVEFDFNVFESTFVEMMNFVDTKMFPLYFKKSADHLSVPRIRFEALSLGISFALASSKPIIDGAIESILTSKELPVLTVSDASNSAPKVKDRINFVRNTLIGEPWSATSQTFIDQLPSDEKFE